RSKLTHASAGATSVRGVALAGGTRKCRGQALADEAGAADGLRRRRCQATPSPAANPPIRPTVDGSGTADRSLMVAPPLAKVFQAPSESVPSVKLSLPLKSNSSQP